MSSSSSATAAQLARARAEAQRSAAAVAGSGAAPPVRSRYDPQANYVQMYRSTTVGRALTDALDELLDAEQIDEATAFALLRQFDQSLFRALTQRARTEVSFTGHLSEYRLVDSVWTWLLSDAKFEVTPPDGQTVTVHSPKCKIVAMKMYSRDEQ